ncbi:MAG: YCF48-related protein, partial [Ignavibacteria bacterium]
MKKIILITILFFCLIYSAYGQWYQINSPTSNDLFCVIFTDTSTGYISGNLSGTIYKTLNGGTTWVAKLTGTSSNFHNIKFLNAATGFAAGSSCTVIKTTNGGESWTTLLTGTSTLNSVCFPDLNTGYIIGNFPMLFKKTTDGGTNWFDVAYPSNSILRDCSFVTGTTGWICGYDGIMFKTSDGGSTWISQSQGASYNFERIEFIDQDYGTAVGSNGGIFRTIDGGDVWYPGNPGLTTGYYCVRFNDHDNGWIAGASGIVAHTGTGGMGTNWFRQYTPSTTAVYYGISDPGYLVGYIVGNNGIVLKTINSGGDPYTGIKKIAGEIPASFYLYQNYPNPFNPATEIRFSVPKYSRVNISIYDLTGNAVSLLTNRIYEPGTYKIYFSGYRLASGVYFCILKTEDFSQTRKLVILK